MRKTLHNYEVIRVISRSSNGNVIMRAVNRLNNEGSVPDGHFCSTGNGIYLPKRRRGEKFIVHYTVVKEAVL